MAKVRIHGKRIETIHAFTVEYKGEKHKGKKKIVARYGAIEEDKGYPLYEVSIEWDKENHPRCENPRFFGECSPGSYPYKDIDKAIKAYDKAHR